MWVRCGAVLAVLCALVSQSLRAQSDAELFSRLAHSVVEVRAGLGGGAVSMGSAVIIAPGKLVTNCHVTRDSERIVIVHAGESIEVEKQFIDIEHDLCLLFAAQIRGPVVALASTSQLKVGQDVIAIGYSGGFRLGIAEGQVNALYRHDGAPVVRSSAWFSVGASGGGLFDREGRLVGILTFKSRASDGFNFAVPVEWLARVESAALTDVTQDMHRLAFWEREVKDEPYYLRAAWFEASGLWTEAQALAGDWVASEPDNAEAWLALGRAQRERTLTEDAEKSLRRAVELDAMHAEAWLQLGLTYSTLVQRSAMENVRSKLIAMGSALAARLEGLQ